MTAEDQVEERNGYWIAAVLYNPNTLPSPAHLSGLFGDLFG